MEDDCVSQSNVRYVRMEPIPRILLVEAFSLLRRVYCVTAVSCAPFSCRFNEDKTLSLESRAKELTDRIGTNLGSLQLNLSNLLAYRARSRSRVNLAVSRKHARARAHVF